MNKDSAMCQCYNYNYMQLRSKTHITFVPIVSENKLNESKSRFEKHFNH